MPAHWTDDYVDTYDVAMKLRFINRDTGEVDRKAAREYLASQRVPVVKRGHVTLYRLSDVEKTLRVKEHS